MSGLSCPGLVCMQMNVFAVALCFLACSSLLWQGASSELTLTQETGKGRPARLGDEIVYKCTVTSSALLRWVVEPLIPKLDPLKFWPHDKTQEPEKTRGNFKATLIESVQASDGSHNMTSLLTITVAPELREVKPIQCRSTLDYGDNDAEGQVVIGFDSKVLSIPESQLNVIAVLRIINGSVAPGDNKAVEVTGHSDTALGGGIDFDYTQSRYTFTDTKTVHYVSVAIIEDTLNEQMESFQLLASSSDAGVIIDPDRVDVSIINREPRLEGVSSWSSTETAGAVITATVLGAVIIGILTGKCTWKSTLTVAWTYFNTNALMVSWTRCVSNFRVIFSDVVTWTKFVYRITIGPSVQRTLLVSWNRFVYITRMIILKPVIVTHPTERLCVVPKTQSTFSVTAKGIGLIKYQWQKDSTDIKGAISSHYIICSTTEQDEGIYKCVISNATGKMTSNSAMLTVLRVPVLESHPADATVVCGKEVELSVTASGPGADIRYQWRQSGNAIPGATEETFTIDEVLKEHEGDYVCAVSNGAGEVESNSAKVTVLRVPVIESHPADATVVCGKEVELSVTASGPGADIRYQWRQSGNAIPGATEETFTIDEVLKEHEGDYVCAVSNVAGEVESNSAKVTVYLEIDLRYILCRNLFSADVETKVITNLNPLSTTMKGLCEGICSEEGVEEGFTVELYSHDGCPFNGQLKSTLKECRVSKNALFYVFIRRVKQPDLDEHPQGNIYGKWTYTPTFQWMNNGVSKFFSILRYICSKKREDNYRSRLLSYLQQHTNCPPMVYALKHLFENPKPSLPYWVALVEGYYQLFRSFLSTSELKFDDKMVFEFSDYFWGLIIGKSQAGADGALSRPVDPNHKGNLCIPKWPLPCSWTDLHAYLVFLPIVPPDYLNGECLTFIFEGNLVYFEGLPSSADTPDKKRDVYDAVKCETVAYTEDQRNEIAKSQASFSKVIIDLRSLQGDIESSEPEEAIMVLLDSSSSMKEPFGDMTRMDAAKEFFEAFAICCRLYKYHISMGLITFSSKSKVEVLHDLDEMNENSLLKFRESLKKHTELDDATALYQAVEEAKNKLRDYTDTNSYEKCRRRILCLGDGDHTEGVRSWVVWSSPYDEQTLKQNLKKLNVIVDAVEVADTKKNNLEDLTKTTGGKCMHPRHRPKLFEMHELLSNKLRLRTTTD